MDERPWRPDPQFGVRKEFHEDDQTVYATLSHRWVKEVDYVEMVDEMKGNVPS